MKKEITCLLCGVIFIAILSVEGLPSKCPDCEHKKQPHIVEHQLVGLDTSGQVVSVVSSTITAGIMISDEIRDQKT